MAFPDQYYTNYYVLTILPLNVSIRGRKGCVTPKKHNYFYFDPPQIVIFGLAAFWWDNLATIGGLRHYTNSQSS